MIGTEYTPIHTISGVIVESDSLSIVELTRGNRRFSLSIVKLPAN
ncbi:hypothetical protein [Bifidobacterium amazonense]|nr:hypothetical protein [Bifidobacterium amazonense]